MFHPDTQHTLGLWLSLADRTGGVPARRDLDPTTLGARLTRVFVVDSAVASLPIRLAGDWIEAVHARPLGGTPFAELWHKESRPQVCAAVLRTVREGRPVVLTAAFESQAVQMTLAPFRSSSGAVDRLVGSYGPERSLVFAPRATRDLSLLDVQAIGAPRRPALNLATRHGRRVA